MEKGQPFCLECADLDHLLFLPSGDAALSRRAKRHSTLWAVVVRFSRTRRRYERQGLLVEEGALERAEKECEADAKARQIKRESRRLWEAKQDEKFVGQMTMRIREIFPNIPPENALKIARHTAQRNSGRVGRTNAGRSLEEEPLRFAVIAHIRHEFTRYDELLMRGVDRQEARRQIGNQIEVLLERWEHSTHWKGRMTGSKCPKGGSGQQK